MENTACYSELDLLLIQYFSSMAPGDVIMTVLFKVWQHLQINFPAFQVTYAKRTCQFLLNAITCDYSEFLWKYLLNLMTCHMKWLMVFFLRRNYWSSISRLQRHMTSVSDGDSVFNTSAMCMSFYAQCNMVFHCCVYSKKHLSVFNISG